MTKTSKSIAGASAATARHPPQVALEWLANGALGVYQAGDTSRLDAATGSVCVTSEIVRQAAKLGSHEQRSDEGASNFLLGFADAMRPRDPAEALLVAQMAAIHQATMMMARRLNLIANLPQQDAAERALNKLARTFALQMDTLKRYRSKGTQTVRVERVTVESGGQAIVGAVETERGGRGRDEA